jgi:hypothetical protein
VDDDGSGMAPGDEGGSWSARRRRRHGFSPVTGNGERGRKVAGPRLDGRRGLRHSGAPIRRSDEAQAPATGMVGAGDSACSRSDGAGGSVKLRAAETFDSGQGRRREELGLSSADDNGELRTKAGLR